MALDASTIIARLAELPDRNRACGDIEAIFFETGGTREFDTEADRAAFRERWLTRYLAHFPNDAFVALATDGAVAGYLVGCLEDPARNALFSDISYFGGLAHLTQRFPAHLHINLTARYRSQGIGAQLIEAFAAHAARAGAPGMHVVTGEGARNNRFYLACGFEHLETADWNGNAIAFLGRLLASPEGQPRLPHLPLPDALG
ncbi:MAG: GNAT family N-acetyltransferase [Hyphomicrobiaceae bacterium]|nr:GNAT family N-acetyltransferase [Hyphomicrobiaceae bacterium]